MCSDVSKGSEVSLVKGFIYLSEQLYYACAREEADLDALAAALPAEYEGHWIAELVRPFALARGQGEASPVAAYLGDTSYKTVQRTLLPELMAAFESGLRSVRLIRGKVF